MKKKGCAILLFLAPLVLFAQDSLPHVSILPLEIISERSLKADELHALDSSLLQRTSYLDIATTLQRSGIGMVNSYGAPGSIASFRLGGMSSNYVTVELNGAVLNSPTLGMADLSLIPAFFVQSASLGERNFSGFQRNVGLAANLRLESHSATRNEVAFESAFSSLNNLFYGVSVSKKKDKLSWDLRSFQARNENKFNYRDVYQWGTPWVAQNNNNNISQGVQSNLVYAGKKRTHYFNTMAVNRYALLPAVMGGVGGTNANQRDDLFQSTFYCEGKRKDVFSFFHVQSKQGVSVILSNQEYSSNVVASQIQTSQINAFVNGSIQMRRALFQLNPTVGFTSLQYRDWNEEVNWKGGSLWASYIQGLAKGKFKLVSWIKPEWRSDRSPIVSGEVGLELPLKLKKVSSQFSFSGSVKSRMPSANDLYWLQGGNPDLHSERAKWIQFKWDNKIDFEVRKSIQFQINAKAGNVENWIQWLPLPENIWLASNFKSVSMKQIEAVSTLKLPVANDDILFSVRTEFTRTTASNIGSPGVFNIVYTPQFRASANAQYTHNAWSLMLSNSFVSKRFTDEGNTDFYALPYFNLFNFCLNRDWQLKGNNFATQFEVQNVFNSEYQWIRGYAMPGRVYSLSLKFFIH